MKDFSAFTARVPREAGSERSARKENDEEDGTEVWKCHKFTLRPCMRWKPMLCRYEVTFELSHIRSTLDLIQMSGESSVDEAWMDLRHHTYRDA